MPHEQAVPGAGGVHVVALVVVHEPVVGGVVDAAEGQRRPQVVALGGVVVHHVEDHLDTGLVQGADHRLEFLHLLAAPTVCGVAVMRGEEADGVVAPVVVQPAVVQVAVGDELMYRHQLDRRDAQPMQVRDDRRVRQPQVCPALFLGDDGVLLGQAADVRLVDDGLVVASPRRPVQAPVEVRVDHHRARDVRRGVGVVAPVRVPEGVGEHRLAPCHVAVDGLGVRVEQQLGLVTALPGGRVVRPVHPVSVPLARADPGQVPVPDKPVNLAQLDPALGAVVVEQAQLDPVGYLGEQPEVGPGPVIGSPQRIAVPGPYGSRRQRVPHSSRSTCVPSSPLSHPGDDHAGQSSSVDRRATCPVRRNPSRRGLKPSRAEYAAARGRCSHRRRTCRYSITGPVAVSSAGAAERQGRHRVQDRP